MSKASGTSAPSKKYCRWYCGFVEDVAFKMVAKRACTNVPTVIAVWASLLELAADHPERGCFEHIDAERIDCNLGLTFGTTEKVLEEMNDCGFTHDDRVTHWGAMNPKRERIDDSSGRVRDFRARKKERLEAPKETGKEV